MSTPTPSPSPAPASDATGTDQPTPAASAPEDADQLQAHQDAATADAETVHEAATAQVQADDTERREALAESLPLAGVYQAVRLAKTWVSDKANHDIIKREYKRNAIIRELTELQIDEGGEEDGLPSAKDLINGGDYLGARNKLERIRRDLDSAGWFEPLKEKEPGQAILDELDVEIARVKELEASPPETAEPEAAAPETVVPDAAPAASADEEPSSLMLPEEEARLDELGDSTIDITSKRIIPKFDETITFLGDQKESLLENITIRAKKGKEIRDGYTKAKTSLEGFSTRITELDTKIFSQDSSFLSISDALPLLSTLGGEVDSFFGESVASSEAALVELDSLTGLKKKMTKGKRSVFVATIDTLKATRQAFATHFQDKEQSYRDLQGGKEEVSTAMAARGVESARIEDAMSSGAEKQAERASKTHDDSKEKAGTREEEDEDVEESAEDEALASIAKVYEMKDDLMDAVGKNQYIKALMLGVVMMLTVVGNLGILMEDSGGLMDLVGDLFSEEEEAAPPESIAAVLDSFSITAENDRLKEFKDIPLADLLAHKDGTLADDSPSKETLDLFKETDEGFYAALMTEVFVTNEGNAFMEAAETTTGDDDADADDSRNMTLGGFIQSKLESWKRTEN
jgi:hypothetical protein